MWIPDPDIVWKGAVLLEDYVGQKKLRVEYEDGEVGNTLYTCVFTGMCGEHVLCVSLEKYLLENLIYIYISVSKI